jgi:dipeptidyl aminopeptidase
MVDCTLGLASWLVNAFNGEWHRTANPVPDESMLLRLAKRVWPGFAH